MLINFEKRGISRSGKWGILLIRGPVWSIGNVPSNREKNYQNCTLFFLLIFHSKTVGIFLNSKTDTYALLNILKNSEIVEKVSTIQLDITISCVQFRSQLLPRDWQSTSKRQLAVSLWLNGYESTWRTCFELQQKGGIKEFFGARFIMDHSANMDIAKGELGWASALPREVRTQPSRLTNIYFFL